MVKQGRNQLLTGNCKNRIMKYKVVSNHKYILTISCRAGTGVVAAVAGFLAVKDCNIVALEQFDDESTSKFFMRAVFQLQEKSPSIQKMQSEFISIADKFEMDWKFVDPNVQMKVLIMVSKFDHCLDDLLFRKNKGELNMDVVAVVSNHKDLRHMAEREGIRFVHLPVMGDNKLRQEAEFRNILEETGAELVVLARYMQILSDEMSEQLAGHCINIHHSFLPGFKGAKPYHQAYDRGVKVIGATAHYVTKDLDEGPIIEQILTRVGHNYQPEDLIRTGRDNECLALAKAVKYHIEGRVFLDGNKTVVFLGG